MSGLLFIFRHNKKIKDMKNFSLLALIIVVPVVAGALIELISPLVFIVLVLIAAKIFLFNNIKPLSK
jgi:uncharacterized membrane protein